MTGGSRVQKGGYELSRGLASVNHSQRQPLPQQRPEPAVFEDGGQRLHRPWWQWRPEIFGSPNNASSRSLRCIPSGFTVSPHGARRRQQVVTRAEHITQGPYPKHATPWAALSADHRGGHHFVPNGAGLSLSGPHGCHSLEALLMLLVVLVFMAFTGRPSAP
jgi:hypothetical protein